MTMAQPVSVLPVKLFVAALYRESPVLEEAISLLRQTWGDTDFISQDFRFEATDYYEEEMGKDLFRRFYSFRKLISPDQIVECKLHSNEIEQTFANNGMRRINLDPGYIDYYKLVLASAKFGGQKIYLREGIYGDMTLVMYKGKWESFTWGFPDFKSGSYDGVLSTIRNLYKTQVKEKSASD
jgi:Domain of unknown function (DUF4416)